MTIGVDIYNLALTGGVAKTLTSKAADANHIPCVMYDDINISNPPAKGSGQGGQEPMIGLERSQCLSTVNMQTLMIFEEEDDGLFDRLARWQEQGVDDSRSDSHAGVLH